MAKGKNSRDLNDEFYTVEKASEILNVSLYTLRKYLREKKLKGFKKFGRWYIFKSDLQDYLTKED